MGKSSFFTRIKADVLKIVSAIPAGKCCTYAAIGEHLDVVPRHVAYILASLSDAEKSTYPWYRVVGNDGLLGQLKVSESGALQNSLLQNEGLLVTDNKISMGSQRWFISSQELNSGVAKQSRPADAPVSSRRARKPKVSGLK
jgi:methylated-DNA-protein-cysteine methyltransferase related protein